MWVKFKKIFSVGEVWIFFETTHCTCISEINGARVFLIKYAGKSKAEFILKKNLVVTPRVF